MIPYGRQDIDQADIDAVIKVLRSDFLTQGPLVPHFESLLTELTTAKRAVAVNSATSALHIACLALDLGPGDIAWTSPISFVASSNCALYCGAFVDFVDIDPDTFCMSVDRLEEKLKDAEAKGSLPKVIVPVHMGGMSCDMQRIYQLSKRFNFRIIEDASHAIGGTYKGTPVGSCKFSDITVFSFHPVKIVTAGEGGAALTNSDALAKKMQLLRSHGITRDFEQMLDEPDGAWSYQQTELGFNYRMTDIHAALGVSQLRKLPEYVKQRNEIATQYQAAFENDPIQLPAIHPDVLSAYHLYIMLLPVGINPLEKRIFFDAMRSAGIGVNVHYIPIHTQPYYKALGFGVGDFPVAEDFYLRAISLPLYPTLKDTEIKHVITSVKELIQ